MSLIQDLSGYDPTWCPGCGNWGIGVSLKSALVKLGYNPSSVMIVFGIGCSGNMNDFVNANAIHSLHGRSIPNAIGMKITNHSLPVIAVVGDGDCYGEGGNHLVHACRGNHDITVIVHDNRVYGLTTGQVAPTAQKGTKSKSTPQGIIERSLDPLVLALSQGASFVGQSFTGDSHHLTEMIVKGIKHKGFSLINVLQPCVTFNKINTYQYYLERVYKLKDEDDKTNFEKAILLAVKSFKEDKFPLGVIYQEKKPTYTDCLPQISQKTLIGKEKFNDFGLLVKDFI